jgi:predicted nicotinamide N-methyase
MASRSRGFLAEIAARPRIEEIGGSMATHEAAAAELDRDRKAAERAMWALGDYHRFAKATVWEVGPVLVEACGISRGHRVLDVATGTGNVAVRAAEAGAHVVASTSRLRTSRRGAARLATEM